MSRDVLKRLYTFKPISNANVPAPFIWLDSVPEISFVSNFQEALQKVEAM